jgi:hypothetical protein
MVPCRTACGDRGVEQLLACGRIRQADTERACTLQRQVVQVLLMQRDAEAGLEIALDHALAMDLENSRCCEPAHQRLAHTGRIGTRLGSEDQRLADGLMVKATMIWLATLVVCPSPAPPTSVMFWP